MPSIFIEKLTIANKKDEIVNLFKKDFNSIKITNSLALVGQSGSGKSLTLKTLLGMTPKELHTDFKYKSDFDLTFDNIGFIPQNPFTSLSSMTKIDKQFFCETSKMDKLLNLVKLPLDIKKRFPVQLSGGQLQRVVIAIALSNNPKILLLDEPTTALDNISKENILNLILELQKELGFIFIFVSHDIESIKNICEDIAILKDGNIIEHGKVSDILKKPTNSYTKALIESNFKNREFRV
ncbi:MAG: ATP-binding cassette domain-containing protein [Campylobacterota bacterium]|nr:ATP-binding cassette domain-containing protein [Campylobacterota bacterium]